MLGHENGRNWKKAHAISTMVILNNGLHIANASVAQYQASHKMV